MPSSAAPGLANVSVVQKIVQAQKLHLVHQFDALRRLRLGENFQVYRVADSVTLQSSAEYGRKLNHTCGLGVNGPVTDSDLLAIESAFEATGKLPELDMCEFAHPSVFGLLKTRGYRETGTISTLACSLTELSGDTVEATVGIEINPSNDVDVFVNTSIEGFRSGGRLQWLLNLLAQSAAHRPDSTMFFARVDGEIAGAAGLACLDLGDGVKFANLYIDSTLPAYREKGVHKALIQARLAAAKKMGCEVAMASAMVGSGSARNLERAGMDLVFTSKTWTKQPSE